MKKVLVPCNFDQNSRIALDWAARLVSDNGGVVTLIHVFSLPGFPYSERIEPFGINRIATIQAVSEGVEQELGKIALEAGLTNSAVELVVREGRVCQEIERYIRENGPELMIIGQTENTFHLGDHIFGTLTDKIVHRSPIPTLVVKQAMVSIPAKVVMADDLAPDPKWLLEAVKGLQDFFRPEIMVVRINTAIDFMSESYFDEQVSRLKKNEVLKDVTFHTTNHSNVTDGLLYFAKKHGADLLVVKHKHAWLLRRWIVGEDLAEQLMDFTSLLVLIW